MEDMKLTPENIGILTTLLIKELRGKEENRCFSSDADRRIKKLMEDLNNLEDEIRKGGWAYQIIGKVCEYCVNVD